METCCNCGKDSENEDRPCAGAVAEEREQNVPEPLIGQGLQTCNCCDNCRSLCHNSWMEENKI